MDWKIYVMMICVCSSPSFVSPDTAGVVKPRCALGMWDPDTAGVVARNMQM